MTNRSRYEGFNLFLFYCNIFPAFVTPAQNPALENKCVWFVVGAQFPWVLNMEPYTVSGMARQDCSGEGSEGRGDGTSGGSPRKKVTISENYELVGVVVHSGQAHAGHYYSFIKDRR